MSEEREFSPCGLVSATKLKNPKARRVQEAPSKEVGPSLRLEWRKIPESLPPGAEDYWLSPWVWLALSNGSVVRGKCLHRTKNATHSNPVHDWFAGSRKIPRNIKVLAWMPFAKPDFPLELLQP